MFSLSTSWNVGLSKSIQQVLKEIEEVGFKHIELGFSHTSNDIPYINRSSDLRILSLHNICPIPLGLTKKEALPDCYNLASLNKDIRKKAIFFAKRTITTAKKLNAKVVILHAGRVEINDLTKRLISLKKKGKNYSTEFNLLKKTAISQRENNKKLFLKNVLLSFEEITNFAYKLGIKIGLENRIYIREIPNFEEIEIFLKKFHKKGLFYWHDIGHAYILDKLGFENHLNYLKRYSKHLIGVHFHDVKNLKDHMAPFTGEINFKSFKPYIKKNTIKVIEAHKPASKEEIVLAKTNLDKIFN